MTDENQNLMSQIIMSYMHAFIFELLADSWRHTLAFLTNIYIYFKYLSLYQSLNSKTVRFEIELVQKRKKT